MSVPRVDCGGSSHFENTPAEKDGDGFYDDKHVEAPPNDICTRDRSLLPPTFTPRDEEREWASVTPGEMLEIEADLRGMSIDSVCGSGYLLSSLIAGRVGKESGPRPTMTEEERETALLPALEIDISAMPESEKEAYLEATRKCPDLVDDEHKKTFLFKEGFDTKLAARRLALHWQYKRQLFGPEKCYLPMTLSGAMSDDMIALSSGFLHLLNARDAFGRAIIYADPSKHHATMYSKESMLRVFWYLLHIATEDPVVRRRGMLFIIYPRHGAWNQFDSSLFRSMRMLGLKYMCPMTRAVHLCHPGPMFHIINPILKFIFGDRLRKRFKLHVGTDEAVLSSLAGFGLARDILPSELGGKVHLNQVQWLSDRMLLEGLNSQFSPAPAATVSAIVSFEQVQAGAPTPIAQRPRSKLPESNIEPNNDLDAELNNLESIISSLAEAPVGVNKLPSASTCQLQPLPAMLDGISDQLPSKEIECAMASKRSKKRQSRGNDEEDGHPGKGSISAIRTLPPVERSNRQTAVKTGRQMNRCMHDAKVSYSQAMDKCNADSVRPTQPSSLQSKPLMGSPVTPPPPRRKAKPRGVAAKGGDPRMTSAIEARLADPHMSLLDALIVGGFKFPTKKEKGVSDKSIMDSEGVSLYQRKNQLNRRLRESRREDPRMARAVAALRTNPTLSLHEALVEGGYKYCLLGAHVICDRTVKDAENVSLHSRKTELKKKLENLGLLDPAAYENVQTGALSGFHETHGSMTWPQVERDGNQRIAHEPVRRVSGCDDVVPKQVSLPHTSRFEETNISRAGGNAEKGLCMKRNDSFEESIRELPGLADLDGNNDHGNEASMQTVNEQLLGSWLWGGTGYSSSPCQQSTTQQSKPFPLF